MRKRGCELSTVIFYLKSLQLEIPYGGGAPATPSGTVNNAGEIFTAGDKNMVRSFAIPTPDASRYTDITVNYTVSGQHGLDEGFVIRYGEIQPDGSVILRTYGEGDNWRQAPALKPFWIDKVDEVWQKNQKEIIQKTK